MSAYKYVASYVLAIMYCSYTYLETAMLPMYVSIRS